MSQLKPTHSKAALFAATDAFYTCRTFKDLEAAISTLPRGQFGTTAKNARGHAFEVLAEAYFATIGPYRVKHVWAQVENVPEHIREKLNIPREDKGIDGVLELTNGKFVCYQVKFRTGRKSQTWKGLGTFFGLAGAASKCVITNSEELAKTVISRKDAVFVRGSTLDALSGHQLKTMLAFVRRAVVEPEKPRDAKPHQKEALRDIALGFKKHDRVTVVMACGTGKTLVAQRAAEQMAAPLTVVFVPSIALVSQTFNDWRRDSKWKGFAYFCICSDKDVDSGKEADSTKISDLVFPVHTDPKEIQRFLREKTNQKKVIFSTYQSAWALAKALKKSPVQLAIFDEAHKTAGPVSKQFSLALNDKNIRIKKRLFLTATPRRYNILKRNKEGDAIQIYSMDEKSKVYGPIVHELSFRRAVNQKLIVPFRVIVSLITDKDLTRVKLRSGQTKIRNNEVRSEQVAHQLALKAAVHKTRSKKIFTFHHRVEAAKDFVKQEAQGIQTHLKGFFVDHIRGETPIRDRNRILKNFQSAKRGLVSNARCLTEGVNVPSVDMVAFVSPRKSKIDIIQAAGRAMRRAHGKKIGNILVPLFVEQKAGETLEQAISRVGMDGLWNTLEALREQDEVLADVIRVLNEAVGQNIVSGHAVRAFKDLVEIIAPRSIKLTTLQRSIQTTIVERIGETWDRRYGELKAYKSRHGDCNVPQSYGPLGSWLTRQRKHRREGLLEKRRFNLLDKLGVDWNPIDQKWRQFLHEMESFYGLHGHMYPETSKNRKWRRLGKLAGSVRYKHKRDELSKDQLRGLENISFPLRVYGETLDSTKGLVSENDLAKKTGLKNLRLYLKRGTIKAAGIFYEDGWFRTYFHPKTGSALMRKLGISLTNTTGLLSESESAKKLGLASLARYRRSGLITPVGKGQSLGSLSYYYKKGEVRKLKRKLGFFGTKKKGMVFLKQARNMHGLSSLKELAKKGLIRVAARIPSNAGVSDLFWMKDLKALQKRIGITLLRPSPLLMNKKAIIEKYGLYNIDRYWKAGMIKPAGRGRVSHHICFLFHKNEVTRLLAKLGVTLRSTHGLISERQLSLACGMNVRKLRVKGLIKPVGMALRSGGVTPFYRRSQIESAKFKLGITVKKVGKRLTLRQLANKIGLSQRATHRIVKQSALKYEVGVVNGKIVKVFSPAAVRLILIAKKTQRR